MSRFSRPLGILFLLFLASFACASPIDCGKASSAAEKTICGSEHGYLIDQDAKLDHAFTRLLQTLPEDQRPMVLAEQKQWLRKRDQCREDRHCLADRYTERLKAVNGRWEVLSAYTPDENDIEALAQFRAAIEQYAQMDTEMPLEKAIKKFSIAKELVSIGQGCVDVGDPGERPRNVSKEEWAAFLTLSTHAGVVNSCAAFSWLDVDGDRQRELLASTYGGNADFETILKRSGKTFRDIDQTFEALWSMEDSVNVFVWGCKGCDEETDWVRINGRVYRAYWDTHFGMAEAYLLTPLRINHLAPRVIVKYGHALKVGASSAEDSNTSERLESLEGQQQRLLAASPQFRKALQSAIGKQLKQLNEPSSNPSVASSSPICPIPKGISKEGRAAYMQYGDTYYGFESVVDFPVWINKQCQIARLLSAYPYSKDAGVFAWVEVRRPDTSTEDAVKFDLTGRRFAISVESGLARFRP